MMLTKQCALTAAYKHGTNQGELIHGHKQISMQGINGIDEMDSNQRQTIITQNTRQ